MPTLAPHATAGDKDGKPDGPLLAATEGYTLLHTDQNGWIELTMDGDRMWVEGERQKRYIALNLTCDGGQAEKDEMEASLPLFGGR